MFNVPPYLSDEVLSDEFDELDELLDESSEIFSVELSESVVFSVEELELQPAKIIKNPKKLKRKVENNTFLYLNITALPLFINNF
ncbi:K+ transporter [Aquibacillus albus]|uniref:K+ transporter n=1 Tax=Aquibacillus albus TaxID=1168171 RepID=A0ABS2N4G6_9BACI|nr:K+ transporter [Aquibacillus albus]